ncbi:hydrogenase formation protein HypD [Microbulbifer hydrolyticus]|uniref:Hydrogenase maturation factor n=1 Tax=Microbulbifer hydrolyticus TaxID=48074 RepID=A0A6P1TAR5_9GAMM|nr:hydrogenase formation protein HypD [Microbulbifer hydrolyticus]MBB5210419.1 hydrogenase expression/formation protein HypD [Microbulbifer hydrolyticus]QHQ39097.1 hydrogenase formation protein HypD [Microbulbifer hydrolyticus]
MKYVNEYRQKPAIDKIAGEIARITTRPWTIMEVCGGQTHAIVKYGLQQFLPESVELVHGPGCPVCVTSLEIIDKAIAIAGRPDVIFCSFGDMLRVPGSHRDLLSVKAAGGDVRAVYSPLHAVELAEQNPEREVVFFAIGFETTAPANAMAVFLARQKRLRNFSVLVSHFLVPPAIETICSATGNRVQGFLAAGHVCAVTGYAQYHALAQKYRIPLVVTGFEPLDVLEGVLMCVRQLERGRCTVENQYRRAVQQQGNIPAQQLLKEVFEVSAQTWRGVGTIEASGLRLRRAFSTFDAARKFELALESAPEDNGCISGEIMQGRKKPADCPHFGRACNPQRPLGAPMVSSEGACAAYYRYNRLVTDNEY